MRSLMFPGLSKPSFCPGNPHYFVCGTEDQDPYKRAQNQLICAYIGDSDISIKFTYPTIDVGITNSKISPIQNMRDLQWIEGHVIFACNSKLGRFELRLDCLTLIGLMRLSHDFTVEDVIQFPEFHKEAIRYYSSNRKIDRNREISVSEGNKNLVISGGFDGQVFVTDISRLISDIQKNEKKSENSLYPCR